MKTNRLIFTLICIVFFAALFLCSLAGSTSLTWSDLFLYSPDNAISIFWELRFPRILTALTSGGLLALSGVLMQILLQNPLADPYILGISGGAAFSTLLLMILGWGEFSYQTGACFGSLLTLVLIFIFARKHHFQAQTLLLMGVALSCGYSSAISLLLILSDDTTIHTMLFWMSGDLNNAHYPWFGLSVLVVCAFISYYAAPGLNVLLRGEKDAEALGLPLRSYKLMLLLLSALCTASAVTLVGCIGFIGLIVPHLTRRLLGYDHHYLIPGTILLGASLLMIADMIARTAWAPLQLPVGIFMTFIGVPIFIWLLKTCQH